MATELEIRVLRREDTRDAFRCGQADLDRFFRDYAGQNQFRLHVAVTHVAVLDAEITGFATVTSGTLERRNLPTARLRRRMPAYPLPVVRLARLGVANEHQGHGIGRALLRHVLRVARTQRDVVGCVGVVTDAKRASIPFYEELGFSALDDVREGRLHGDPTPLLLPMATIAAAL